MRILISIFSISFLVSSFAAVAQRNDEQNIPLAPWEITKSANAIEKIDPIVTGQAVSPDDVIGWEKRKERFLECGLCGEGQPFPGDLPEN